MSDDPLDGSRDDREEEFREMLREILNGNSDIDPARLASAAGLPDDPALIAQLMSQLQSAIQSSSDGINWSLATDQARQLAQRSTVVTLPAERTQLEQSFHIASLWLAESTSISELTSEPRLMSRTEWVSETMPVWIQLAEPVALSIADSLSEVFREQAPEELTGMVGNIDQVMRNLGGTLFAMQLGHVVGQLAIEVVSGGDIGIPLIAGPDGEQQAVMIAQNVTDFASGLDIPISEVQLYLAVRELAHARLFRHSKWLRLQMLTSITDYARDLHIDIEKLEDLAADFDPSNPERLRDALQNGSLIPERTEEQVTALGRLETALALIEGWVDVVTAEATSRLPKSGAIAETVRRRRASGGPAESAFATLVGLELRPRRLREAAAMWQQLTDAVGAEKRDALWSHPDLVPTAEDIDDPAALIARITAGEPVPDDIDRAIADLLGDTSGDRPHED